ncbi:Ribonuclease H-like superfamily protein [Rhynchospora pubera]|uniref:Ribonuclease H-like superfamily protein n=1 Tax=Rhynchospora pubera TaxID=906938 RepID=A0AAV8G8R6_9POAL|nr:Ribonuclease H-like superfamily protein [Rhynchospora pubera]
MSDENKLWVKMCKAKYFPQLGFWRATGSNGGSPTWRQAIKLKEDFRKEIFWDIGDGENVPALSQPWYPGWSVAQQATIQERRMTVAQLFDVESDQWNTQQLQQLFTAQQVNTILISALKPRRVHGKIDRLIWNGSVSGKYSVREGYNMITRDGQQSDSVQGQIWKDFWKWKNVVPKIKLFMWRLLSHALPVSQNVHRRIDRVSPRCQRCEQENEFEVHAFFYCPGSRAVWFGSNVGFRVEELPLEINEAVRHIVQNMEEDDIRCFAYTLWELWKERNEAVINKKRFHPHKVLQQVRNWLMDQNVQIVQGSQKRAPQAYQYHRHGWQILIDASWDNTKASGTANLIYKGGNLVAMQIARHDLNDPFLAETIAMQEAINHILNHMQIQPHEQGQIFSDCFNLVQAVNEEDMQFVQSWRAQLSIQSIIQQVRDMGDKITGHHIAREAIGPAHELANWARRSQQNYQGPPNQIRWPSIQQARRLHTGFFQQVEEAPP